HITLPRFSVAGSVVTRALHSFPTRRSSDLDHVPPGVGTVAQLLHHLGDLVDAVPIRGWPRTPLHPIDGPQFAGLIGPLVPDAHRSEEHTSELQSRFDLVCRLLLEKTKTSTT